MSLPAPTLAPLDYQSLLADAMARISTHNPDWTNYNHSDPGITLLELFAFITDSLIYRANLIPDRNRIKFLNLLGVPLTRASAATGIVTLSNDHGALQSQTLGGGIEVDAASVSFHTDLGMDLLPIDAQVFTKQIVSDPPAPLVALQQQLYASFAPGSTPASPAQFTLYDTVSLDPKSSGVWLQDTADASVWVALVLRSSDAKAAGGNISGVLAQARAELAGQTLSLGFVPLIDGGSTSALSPTGTATEPVGSVPLAIMAPMVASDGTVPTTSGVPQPAYRTLDATWPTTGFTTPGVVQVQLPSADELVTWSNLDTLSAGVGELPPSLPDIDPQVITWIRVMAVAGTDPGVLWMDINAATVSQKTHVNGEVLPPGTGAPDQAVQLAHTPVLPTSVVLTVTSGQTTTQWTLIDDITCAPPEIPVPDPRVAPGVVTPPPGNPNVFALDPIGGVITFGDGTHGARPAAGATMTVDYDYGAGSAGNVGAGAIANGIALPAGVTVNNPVPTWGGADAESVDEAETQTARYLQHRDRLVTVADFESIAYRTPGVSIARVEVIPATNPNLTTLTPGSAPGAVTLMLIPTTDPVHPDTPEPNQQFLDAVNAYLDPRRLVTTQLYLCGPDYEDIWISVGIDVQSGQSVADVSAAVNQTLRAYLAPFSPTATPWYQADPPSVDSPMISSDGWQLNNPVIALELQAVASRVTGVQYVEPVLLAHGTGSTQDQVSMNGLELPRLAGVSVVSGDPIDLDTLRGTGAGATGTGTTGIGGAGGASGSPSSPLLPVPVIPDTC
jgi:predicted phage baseplate assembly protein